MKGHFDPSTKSVSAIFFLFLFFPPFIALTLSLSPATKIRVMIEYHLKIQLFTTLPM
jgi:hypothetical protein